MLSSPFYTGSHDPAEPDREQELSCSSRENVGQDNVNVRAFVARLDFWVSQRERSSAAQSHCLSLIICIIQRRRGVVMFNVTASDSLAFASDTRKRTRHDHHVPLGDPWDSPCEGESASPRQHLYSMNR